MCLVTAFRCDFLQPTTPPPKASFPNCWIICASSFSCGVEGIGLLRKGILICNWIYVSLATKCLFWRDADKPSICNCKEVFICLFQLTLCCSNIACKSLKFLSRKLHSYKTRDDCLTTTFNMNRISQELEVWWRNPTGNSQLFYQEGLCRVKSWKNAWRKHKWEKQVSYRTWSVQSITWNSPRFCGCLL